MNKRISIIILSLAFGGFFTVLVGPVTAGTFSHDYTEHINKPATNSYVGHRVTFTGWNWAISEYSGSLRSAMYGYDYIEESFIEQNTLGYSNFVRTHSNYHTQKYILDYWPWWGHYEGQNWDIYTDTYQYENDVHQFVDYYNVAGT
ncbi:MAG: hypothetical protein P1Q69_10440 [Candidatus Thorarchaeota archaeon]|nr:hypothetical protein [Candidatus Thorarchaeota archaeon]